MKSEFFDGSTLHLRHPRPLLDFKSDVQILIGIGIHCGAVLGRANLLRDTMQLPRLRLARIGQGQEIEK